MTRLALLLLIASVLLPNIAAHTPVVLWHGLGDICCDPLSMGSIKRMLEIKLEGVYVLSLMIGDSIVSDIENGFFMDVNEQIDFACNVIQNDVNLQNGYNAIGFSQGGLFLKS